MKIVVIGSGAMGSLYGAYLSRVAQVTLFDPWPEHVQALQRDGLLLEELDGSQTRVRVAATTDPASLTHADLAIVFVKSHQTPWAADVAQKALRPSGLALTLQNGVGNREALAEVLGDARAVQGVTAHGATLLGPGRVRHAGKGPTHLGLTAANEASVREVGTAFEAAGLEVHLSSDLDSLIWGKLVINVGINALTAVLRVPNGHLAEIPAARALMSQAVEEAVAVAQALGIRLPYPDAVARTVEVCQATARNRSSMLQDVLRGSPTEIDVINHAVVQQGQRLGLPTPVNALLTQLVHAMEGSYAVRL
ncbi:MAG: 2-dehydropantoate 2-reductase [Chloroflexi bacterium]|nr:2-dehydropantoate 2-reductase [Chloroflexota bacterium]